MMKTQPQMDWSDIVDDSRLMSYFIRWGIRVVTVNRKAKVYIETDQYIGFIPQLNDYHVADQSVLKIHNSFSFGQSLHKVKSIKHKEIIRLSSEDKPERQSFKAMILFVEDKVTIEQITQWKNLLEPLLGKIFLIFPSIHEESLQRLLFETNCMYCKGPVRLDYVYHGQEETFQRQAHNFVKAKFGKALTVKHFEFLARWSCVVFSTSPHKIPDKMPTEIKETN